MARKTMLAFVASFLIFGAAEAFAQCERIKEEQGIRRGRLQDLQNELGLIESQIRDIERKRVELEESRGQKLKEKQELETSLSVLEAKMDSECNVCVSLERQAEAFQMQYSALDNRAQDLIRRIRELAEEARRLDAETDALSREYERLGCANLAAGRTEQATIDRCTQIFSRWNALEKEIDSLENRLRSLRAEYISIRNQMMQRRQELDRLHADLERNCRQSPRLVEVRNAIDRQKEIDALQEQVDATERGIARFRGLKLRPMPRLIERNEKKGLKER
jgi:chromosome segregation ATPase